VTSVREPGVSGVGVGPAGPSTAPVAVLVKRFPRLSETFILHEVLELRRQGLPVRLLAVMNPGEAVVHPEAAALITEVTYLRNAHPILELRSAFQTARRHPRGMARAVSWAVGRRSRAAWRRLLDGLLLVQALGAEPVHLHVHFANAPTTVAFVAHLVTGQPYSVTMHAKDLYTTPAEQLRERCSPATALVTCTTANAAYYARTVDAESPVHVYPHGLALDRFAGVRRHAVPGRILTVGRLVPKKGYLDLVEACRLLAHRGVSFSWDVIGEGPLRPQLDDALARAGLTERVRLWGSLAQREVIEAYAAAELFALAPVVLPDGDRDGIPNAVLEAMAVGVAVVATGVSGVPEVIEDESTGLLAPPGNPAALAERIQRLLTDAELRDRLAAAGKVFAVRRCDLTNCVAPMTALLRNQQAAAAVSRHISRVEPMR